MFGLQIFPSLKKKSAYTKVGFGRVFLEGCDNVTKKELQLLVIILVLIIIIILTNQKAPESL